MARKTPIFFKMEADLVDRLRVQAELDDVSIVSIVEAAVDQALTERQREAE
jgi:uncharacterized protein YigA (DUF484 family)